VVLVPWRRGCEWGGVERGRGAARGLERGARGCLGRRRMDGVGLPSMWQRGRKMRPAAGFRAVRDCHSGSANRDWMWMRPFAAALPWVMVGGTRRISQAN